MANSPHILVVDDDPDVRHELRDYLENQGFRVSVAGAAAAMEDMLNRGDVNLVILDLKMPDEHGLKLTRRLRDKSDIGIIILTGTGAPVDRIVGLELGADDYLEKPCDLRELLARIRSLLRRTPRSGSTGAGDDCAALEFADWRLDLSLRELFTSADDGVALTPAEFSLLKVLAENASRVLTRDQLLDLTKGREIAPFDRSIDNLISRLRRKIEADPKNPVLIKTVHRVGYLFTPKVRRLTGTASSIRSRF